VFFLIQDPSKFVTAAAAKAPVAPVAAAPVESKKEEQKEESDSEGDMGFGLFD
jgi:large subunit ribosomal protein LP0